MNTTALASLALRLGYCFKALDRVKEALRHRSFVNEQSGTGLKDNERLEFIGDAVLNLAVGHLLMTRHPDLKEGDLSRMRAALVNETQLAAMAQDLGMGPMLELGKGEDQTNGRTKPSILAGAFEALLAAVYLDGGFDRAMDTTARLFGPSIETITAAGRDFKSQLQEMVQTQGLDPPRYEVIGQKGPDHDKRFAVRLRVLGMVAQGYGKNKKAAEQDAAARILDQVRGHSSFSPQRLWGSGRAGAGP
jgi:ribonuclease III